MQEARLLLRQFTARITPKNTLYVLILMIFFIIVVGPLIGLLANLLWLVVSGTGSTILSPVFSERRTVLLVQSFCLAVAVAGAGIVIGILIATMLWRTRQKISYAVILLVLALAPIPPYIHALTWSAAITWSNQYLAMIGAAPLPATGWVVSFWVQLMAFLPITIFLSCIGLASVDRTLVEAARVIRSDGEVLRKVILPLAAPSLVAAFGFLILVSCTDYSVPSLFGSDTYALDIFSLYSATGSTAVALIAAIPLLLITFSVLILCRSGIRQLTQTPNWTIRVWDSPPEFPLFVRQLQKCAATLFCLQILVIFSGLLLTTGSWSRFMSAVIYSAQEIHDTVLVVICVVLIALPLCLAVTNELIQPGLRGSFWWSAILVPIAIPSPLIGIGIISLWNSPVLSPFYGTMLMPVIASLARFAPFAAIILFVQMRSIDPVLFDATRIFSRDSLHTAVQIFFPLLAPALFVTSGILAALTIGELGATLIVAPPGFGMLAIKIYNYLHYGAAAEVAGLCLVMAIGTMLAGLVAFVMIIWWHKKREGNQNPLNGEMIL